MSPITEDYEASENPKAERKKRKKKAPKKEAVDEHKDDDHIHFTYECLAVMDVIDSLDGVTTSIISLHEYDQRSAIHLKTGSRRYCFYVQHNISIDELRSALQTCLDGNDTIKFSIL